MTPFAVVIPTRDEELNLPKALASIAGRCPVLIVDSNSVDRTEAIAGEYGAEFVVHKFEDYSKQRNRALEQVQDRFEWIYFLDADEEFTPALWDEVQATIQRDDLDGAYVRWDVRILGRKLKHGEFTHAMMLRLMRPKVARFSRGINERVDDNTANSPPPAVLHAGLRAAREEPQDVRPVHGHRDRGTQPPRDRRLTTITMLLDGLNDDLKIAHQRCDWMPAVASKTGKEQAIHQVAVQPDVPGAQRRRPGRQGLGR